MYSSTPWVLEYPQEVLEYPKIFDVANRSANAKGVRKMVRLVKVRLEGVLPEAWDIDHRVVGKSAPVFIRSGIDQQPACAAAFMSRIMMVL